MAVSRRLVIGWIGNLQLQLAVGGKLWSCACLALTTAVVAIVVVSMCVLIFLVSFGLRQCVVHAPARRRSSIL